jgi:hypothetical protein
MYRPKAGLTRCGPCVETREEQSIVVKLSSLTQLCRRDTHVLCCPCVMQSMGDVVHGCVPTLCWDRLGQFRRCPMGRRIAAVDSALCDPCVTWSRVGTLRSGAQYPRNALFKGRNIQELSVRDTSVRDTSTLHRY